MSKKALRIIQDDYLWDYSPQEALYSAAEGAEDAIPWLIVERAEEGISLSHGEKGPFAFLPLGEVTEKNLRDELNLLKDILREAPQEIPSDIDLEVELLKGLSKHLDRYSSIMHKDNLRRFTERIQGQLSGIGCRVRKVDGGIRILEVFPESPAETQGILKDDIITHIDGVSIQHLTIDEGVERLRGEVGTEVRVQFLREEATQERTLRRAKVRVPNVRLYLKEDGVAHIRIENFSTQTTRGLERVFAEMARADGIKGIVLDLRGNTGGSLIQACNTVDFFIDNGLVLRTEGRDGRGVPRLMREFVAQEDDEMDLPMVLLINSKSASASEIVAGALKLHQRAYVIGQRSHGKGVVQMPHTLRGGKDKVKFKVTVAQYILKDGFSVHENRGVLPHLWMSNFRFQKDQFSHRNTPEEGIPYLLYADEREGWRENGVFREDYVLDFAQSLIGKSEGSSLEEVEAAAFELLPKEKEAEEQQIVSLFAEKNIDWKSGETALGNVDLKVEVAEKTLHAGQVYKWKLKIRNAGDADLHQSYLSLRARAKYMPWHNVHIPIGHLAAGEEIEREVSDMLPIGISSRKEELQIRLHNQEANTLIAVEDISIVGVSVPEFLLDVQLEEAPVLTGETKEYKVGVLLHNQSNRPVEELEIKLFLPNQKEVEFFSVSQYERATMEPNSNMPFSFAFRSSIPLEDIPELKIRVKAENRASKMIFKEKPVNLQSGVSVSQPRIFFDVPTTLSAGTHEFSIQLEDDGHLVDSSLWLDGEKLAWQTENKSWTTKIPLSDGHHKIIVQATDDMGLESSSYHYIHVLP